ncbi:MAG: hypothetical protein ACI3W5_04830, partial [Faecousia sp.]
EIQFTPCSQIIWEHLLLPEEKHPSPKIGQYATMLNHIHTVFAGENGGSEPPPYIARPRISKANTFSTR